MSKVEQGECICAKRSPGSDEVNTKPRENSCQTFECAQKFAVLNCQVLDLRTLTNSKACNVILDSFKAEQCGKKLNEAASVCAHSSPAFVAAGNGKEHTDKGKKKEKLELLQSFLNTGLHFSVDHLLPAVKNR